MVMLLAGRGKEPRDSWLLAKSKSKNGLLLLDIVRSLEIARQKLRMAKWAS